MLNSRLCDDLKTINKTNWDKAMIARSVRKHSAVMLDWIAKELHMGVGSGVTRAEPMPKVRLQNKRAVQKTWQEMEKCVFSKPGAHL